MTIILSKTKNSQQKFEADIDSCNDDILMPNRHATDHRFNSLLGIDIIGLDKKQMITEAE